MAPEPPNTPSNRGLGSQHYIQTSVIDVCSNTDMNPLNPLLKMRLFGVVAILGCGFIVFTLIVTLSPRYGALRHLSELGRSGTKPTRIEESDIQNQTQTPPEISENPTAHALSILLDNLIVPNAKTNYRPEKYKDLDLVEFTRQTVIMKTLWSIYETIPSGDDSPASRLDRIALKDAIEKMQAILFPWITSQNQDNVDVSSIFGLQDSYRSDAGIVITTGKRTFRWTVHQITTLRNVLNCNLPIEIFYAGDDDLPWEYRQTLESISSNSSAGGTIRVVDINQFFPDPDRVMNMPGGWALRPFAILASSFKKVILTDADTVFLQDPSLLLEEPGFQETGAIFFHDRVLGPAGDEVYDWVDNLLDDVNAKYLDDLKKDSEWFKRQTWYELESGALAIDKTRNLMAVLMICHLNLRAQRDTITYRKFYGDKESYWLGHALTSTPYHFVRGYAGGLGRIRQWGTKDPAVVEAMGDEERQKYTEELELSTEFVCTLQLLHVLESNGQPLWFNNALVEFKEVSNDEFLEVDGWVGHDGHWFWGPGRLPNEMCVEPDGRQENGTQRKIPINRVSPEMADTYSAIIAEAKRWDERCEKLGLFHVLRNA